MDAFVARATNARVAMNPYAPPQTVAVAVEEPRATSRIVLASLSKRLIGSIIDAVVQLGVGYGTAYALTSLSSELASELLSDWTVYVCVMLTNAAQWVLLAKRGQTLGKIAVNTKVVLADGRPAPFLNTVVLRAWPLVAVGLLSRVVPALYSVLSLINLADALSIFFGRGRRTLHDYVAGTIVIDVLLSRPPADDGG
jgi:uncharacterized RDD family membrane protein YckC